MFICPPDTKKFKIMPLSQFLSNKAADMFKNIYSRYSSQDDEYLKMIEQYKDTDFYEQLKNNPYLVSNNQAFVPNLMQSFGALFGDYSAWSSYYEELANKRNQEFNKILDAMRKQEYDNPINVASRERAAGLNTDLTGAGSASTPAADIDEQGVASPPQMPGAGQGVEQVLHMSAQVAQAGVSFVSQVIGMGQQLQGLQTNNLAIVAQDLANHGSAMNLLYDEIINTLPTNDIKDIESLDSQVLLRAIKGISEDTSFNRGTRKVLSRYYDSISGDSGTAKQQVLKQELATRYYNSRKDIVDTVSNPRFDKDIVDWISNVGKYFEIYVDQTNKLGARAQQLEYANDIAYYTGDNQVVQPFEDGTNVPYDTHVGAAQGANDSKVAEMNQLDADFKAANNELWSNLANFLKNDTHWYSKLGLLLLPMIRSYCESNFLPHVTFNRDVTTYPNGQEVSKSSTGVE